MKIFYNNTFVRLSVLFLVVFFVVFFVTLRLQNNDLQAEAAQLQTRIDEMSETINELEAEIARPFDDEYVAEIAHEQLGLCFPQEIIYVSGEVN